MQQSEQEQQVKHNEEQQEAGFSKIAHATRQIENLFQQWLEAGPQTGRSKRLESQVQRGVLQVIDEIHAGKTANVEERFQRMIERAEAAHCPKKKATFLQTLDAIQQLHEVSRQWNQETVRSKTEQERALHKLRVLLREIEAGHIENVEERFRQSVNQSKQ